MATTDTTTERGAITGAVQAYIDAQVTRKS